MNPPSLSRFKHLSANGSPLIDFGLQPVSNRFLSGDGTESAPRFPLALRIDSHNGLIHLAEPFPVEELCPRYPWLTCFEPEAHLDEMVERIMALPGIHRDSIFAAYSFKDDTTLARLQKRGYAHTWRLDPSADLGVTNPNANVETYQEHFTPAQAEAIQKKKGLADVFIVRHVLEHANDLGSFLAACRLLVRDGGYIVFEVPDCSRALELNDYTTIWEEHVFYFTPWSLRSALTESGFKIHHFESHPYPFENSLIAITSGGLGGEPSQNEPAGNEEMARARQFAANFAGRREQVRRKLTGARSAIAPMAMFGAGHLSVAFLSLFDVADLIDFVADDNPNKSGLRMPCGNLPILGSRELYNRGTRLCLLSLNPQNQQKVIDKHESFTAQGGKFASIFPGTRMELETVL